MNVIVWSLLACDASDPETTTDERPIYANCSGVSTLEWTAEAEGDLLTNHVSRGLYDEHGSLVEASVDSDDDDSDQSELWTRRADGQFELHTLDAGDDGSVDLTEEVTFDGDLAVRMDVDGEEPAVVTFAYDALDRVVSRKTDEGLDGEPDALWTATYDGDSDRLLETEETTSSGVEVVDTYRWDDAERLAIETLELTSEFFTIRLDWVYTYAGDARVPSSATLAQVYGDDRIDSALSWKYDGADRPVLETEEDDLDGDGSPDRTATTTNVWDCPN